MPFLVVIRLGVRENRAPHRELQEAAVRATQSMGKCLYKYCGMDVIGVGAAAPVIDEEPNR